MDNIRRVTKGVTGGTTTGEPTSSIGTRPFLRRFRNCVMVTYQVFNFNEVDLKESDT